MIHTLFLLLAGFTYGLGTSWFYGLYSAEEHYIISYWLVIIFWPVLAIIILFGFGLHLLNNVRRNVWAELKYKLSKIKW